MGCGASRSSAGDADAPRSPAGAAAAPSASAGAVAAAGSAAASSSAAPQRAVGTGRFGGGDDRDGHGTFASPRHGDSTEGGTAGDFAPADAPSPPALPVWVASLVTTTTTTTGRVGPDDDDDDDTAGRARHIQHEHEAIADARQLASLPAAGWLYLPIYISSSFADPARAKEHALLTHTILPAVEAALAPCQVRLLPIDLGGLAATTATGASGKATHS